MRGVVLIALCGVACASGRPSGSSTGGGSTAAAGSATGSSSGSASGSSAAAVGCATIGEGNPCADGALSGQCCGGQCVDPSQDSLNCGGCNGICPTGTHCAFGECLGPDGGPVFGCGMSCPSGSVCVDDPVFGGMGCAPISCATSDTEAACALPSGDVGMCCSGSCVDFTSDPNNCGLCGYACAAGATCSARGINIGCSACPPDAWSLGDDGPPFFCVPALCTAEQQGLVACAYDGGTRLHLGTCCSDSCIDAFDDPDNCGGCGNVCPTGSFCFGRSCALTSCGSSSGHSNDDAQCVRDAGVVGTCCGDSCVDVNTDANACGECGVVCPAGQTCHDSVCLEPGGRFVPCSANPSACPAGTACLGDDCTTILPCNAANEGQLCLFGPETGGLCCGGRCIDPATDPQNCGACGFATSGACINGLAEPPPPDAGICDVCPAEDFCLGPYCVVRDCRLVNEGLCLLHSGAVGACCPDAFGGSQPCTDLTTDPANCGGCGLACPAGQTCASGSCSGTSAACRPGTLGGFCNPDAGLSDLCCPGGGCTDTSRDPQNCGGCGIVCNGSCVDGNCG